MSDPSRYETLLQIVRNLTQKQAWPLPPAGQHALAEAISPFVQALPEPTEQAIQQIALNYYQDGPTVRQLLDPRSQQREALWQAWHQQFVQMAQAKGLSPTDADDLAQIACIQAQVALHRFRFASRLKTYLIAIFNNQYWKWLRKQTQSEAITIEVEEPEQFGAAPRSTSNEVIRDELRQQVIAIVQEMLKSEDYQILHWYYVEETYIDPDTGEARTYTDKEIGERLGLPLNTVTARRTRALQRLRRNPRLAALFQDVIELDPMRDA